MWWQILIVAMIAACHDWNKLLVNAQTAGSTTAATTAAATTAGTTAATTATTVATTNAAVTTAQTTAAATSAATTAATTAASATTAAATTGAPVPGISQINYNSQSSQTPTGFQNIFGSPFFNDPFGLNDPYGFNDPFGFNANNLVSNNLFSIFSPFDFTGLFSNFFGTTSTGGTSNFLFAPGFFK